MEVKRYPNRKLYITGGYISLAKIGQMLRAGMRVSVTDYRGRDVTAYTICQLISQEAAHGQVFDVAALSAVVRGTPPPRKASVLLAVTGQAPSPAPQQSAPPAPTGDPPCP